MSKLVKFSLTCKATAQADSERLPCQAVGRSPEDSDVPLGGQGDTQEGSLEGSPNSMVIPLVLGVDPKCPGA